MTAQALNASLRLQHFRTASGMTATELAERLGVSRAAYYRYERGGVVKLETIERIAQLSGLTFDAMIAPITEEEADQIKRALLPASVRQRLYSPQDCV